MTTRLLETQWSNAAPPPEEIAGTPLEPFAALFARANAGELAEPLRRRILNSAHNYRHFKKIRRPDLMTWELERLARWETEAAQVGEQGRAA